MTGDGMVGWHHRLTGHGFGWTSGVGDGQGGLACQFMGSQRFNQPILKEVNPEYSLGDWMLKLKLQYFGHLMFRADSLEKTLMM